MADWNTAISTKQNKTPHKDGEQAINHMLAANEGFHNLEACRLKQQGPLSKYYILYKLDQKVHSTHTHASRFGHRYNKCLIQTDTGRHVETTVSRLHAYLIVVLLVQDSISCFQ